MPLDQLPCVALLFKHPDRSKTRLEGLADSHRARVAHLLLSCAEADLMDWDGPICASPAQADDVNALEQLLRHRPDCRVITQVPGNLGDRINALDHALRGLFGGGSIMIGSDCPAMDVAAFHRVTAQLKTHDFVLIRAIDGGLALMAGRKPWPSLNQLPWSTPSLGDAVIAACEEAGHSVATVGCLRDIDSRDDLLCIPDELEQDSRPTRVALVSLVRQWADQQ